MTCLQTDSEREIAPPVMSSKNVVVSRKIPHEKKHASTYLYLNYTEKSKLK